MPIELRAEELDLARYIRPGDTLVWAQGAAEPLTLSRAVVAQRHAIGPITLFLGPGYSETLQPEHADRLNFLGMSAVGTRRRLVEAGVLRLIPCRLSDVESLFDSGILKADVVMLHLCPPVDGSGEYSMGLVNDYLKIAMRRARVVIAQVNDRLPWTYADEPLDMGRVDYLVPSAHPPLEHATREPTAVDKQIARHVAEMVPDGAVVQMGIGAMPCAILDALHGHRRLGLHSGMVTDAVVDLIKSGAVTNETKPFHRDASVTGTLLGTRKLYDFAHRNPALRMVPLGVTHNIELLAKIDNFVSLNSAVEVDLSGQVNAEVAGGVYIGAVGGQVDYVRAARRSRGGKSIIALPATARGDKVSRIVGSLNDPVVTTARSDVDIVVTEYGAAHLRGISLEERARRMIAIAHPNFREALERHARGVFGRLY
ncbi:MAG TPA: acetyl-CoA hydrolase/transferase C-terminal domain-containing protein [Candidatus Binataceae bacterium]|nr:acetyl-CoA hydrolase/transferase C-terminal domain-containing protein [Candidatus Binataceae bacterium]